MQAPRVVPGKPTDVLPTRYICPVRSGSNFHSLQVTTPRSRGWFNTWPTYTYGKALGYTCEDAFVHGNCYGLQFYDRSETAFDQAATRHLHSENSTMHGLGEVLLQAEADGDARLYTRPRPTGLLTPPVY